MSSDVRRLFKATKASRKTSQVSNTKIESKSANIEVNLSSELVAEQESGLASLTQDETHANDADENFEKELALFDEAIQEDLDNAEQLHNGKPNLTEEPEGLLVPRDLQQELREEQEDYRKRVRNLKARKEGHESREKVISITSSLVDDDELQTLSQSALEAVVNQLDPRLTSKSSRKRAFEEDDEEIDYRHSSDED